MTFFGGKEHKARAGRNGRGHQGKPREEREGQGQKGETRKRRERQGGEGRGKGQKGGASEESAGRGGKGTKAKGRESQGNERQSKGNMEGTCAQFIFFYALTPQQPITKFVQGFQPTRKAWLPTSEIEPMQTLQRRNDASGCYAKGSLSDTTKLMGCTVKITWNSLASTIVGA